MQNPADVRVAIDRARTSSEVLTIVRDFLASLTAEEAALVPAGFIPRGITSVDEVMDAALEISHKELAATANSPEVQALRDVASILGAASTRIAAISLGSQSALAG